MATTTSSSLLDRMRGAALFDIATYEAVEHDQGATGQAAIVVVLAALASGIGAIGGEGGSILGAIVGALAGWAAFAGISYLIGDKLLGGTASWGELLRTLGFAQAPGLLLVLGIIPLLGWFVRPLVMLWVLATSIVAIRQALDFGTGKAILTAVLGWLAWAAIGTMLAFLGWIF